MTSHEEVATLLRTATTRFERRVGEAKSLQQQGKAAKTEYENLQKTMIACEEAVAFLNSFADERQQQVQKRVEALVSYGLATIFDDGMTFHVISEQKANRNEVSFVLRSTMGDQTVETPILDARGGGVAAVIGFLLRLIVKLLKDERPLLVVDEGFAQVSEGYLPALGSFIKELVEKTGVQIVMVTHSEIFAEYADTVYQVTQVGGKSVVEKLQ